MELQKGVAFLYLPLLTPFLFQKNVFLDSSRCLPGQEQLVLLHRRLSYSGMYVFIPVIVTFLEGNSEQMIEEKYQTSANLSQYSIH